MAALMGRLLALEQSLLLQLCHRADPAKDAAISAQKDFEGCHTYHWDYWAVRSKVQLSIELQARLDKVVQKFVDAFDDAIKRQELSISVLPQSGSQSEEMQQMMASMQRLVASMQPGGPLSLFTPQWERLRALRCAVLEDKAPSELAEITQLDQNPLLDDASLLIKLWEAQEPLAIKIFGHGQDYVSSTFSYQYPNDPSRTVPSPEERLRLLCQFAEFEAPTLLHLRSQFEAFLTMEYCAPAFAIRPMAIYQCYERLYSVGLLLQSCNLPTQLEARRSFTAACTSPSDGLLQAAAKAYTHLVSEYRTVIVHLSGSPWLSPLPALAVQSN